MAALVSGFFGSYIGGQISLKAERQNCQTQPWGLKTVCETWITPGAIWQGSTTGMWIGCVLGAFVGGLATRKTFAENEAELRQMTETVSLCASDLELTPAQRETIRRFLLLLVVKFDKIHPVNFSRIAMPPETNSSTQSTTGADAIDDAIAAGVDFDGSPIPPAKLELYHRVMAIEAGRQRSGVSNTMRSRIVRIGAKHIPQAELNQMLTEADFAPLKDKEIAFYYGPK